MGEPLIWETWKRKYSLKFFLQDQICVYDLFVAHTQTPPTASKSQQTSMAEKQRSQ